MSESDIADSNIKMLSYSEELAPLFDVINRQWIEDMFSVEDIDEQVLTNPKKHIIDDGGYIWFAEHDELGIVGTCALIKSGDGEFELTKMGVLDTARGLKIGEKLLLFILEFCKTIDCQKLYLLTNHKCESAIHLYEKLGFEHDPSIMAEFGSHYQRCDVAMKYVKL